jgi:hypothetical protein
VSNVFSGDRDWRSAKGDDDSQLTKPSSMLPKSMSKRFIVLMRYLTPENAKSPASVNLQDFLMKVSSWNRGPANQGRDFSCAAITAATLSPG